METDNCARGKRGNSFSPYPCPRVRSEDTKSRTKLCCGNHPAQRDVKINLMRIVHISRVKSLCKDSYEEMSWSGRQKQSKFHVSERRTEDRKTLLPQGSSHIHCTWKSQSLLAQATSSSTTTRRFHIGGCTVEEGRRHRDVTRSVSDQSRRSKRSRLSKSSQQSFPNINITCRIDQVILVSPCCPRNC